MFGNRGAPRAWFFWGGVLRRANRFGFAVRLFLLLSACLLVIAGCGKSRKELLIGTWYAQDTGTFTLKADGTCKTNHTAFGKAPGEPLIRIYSDTDCTWTLDGNTVTLTANVNKNSPEKFEIMKIDETKMTIRWIGDEKTQERTKSK